MPIFPDMPLFEQRLIAALMAILISIVFGGWLATLSRYNRLVSAVHRRVHHLFVKLNKQTRPSMTRAMRGAGLLCFGLFLAVWLGILLNNILEPKSQLGWVLIHIFLLATMLRSSCAFMPIYYMGKAYDAGRQFEMRGYLQSITFSAANAPDHHGQLRLGVMHSYAHLVHGVIGSVVAYLLGGFVGLFAYRMLHLLSVHTPKALDEWQAFGMVIHWVCQPVLRLMASLVALVATIISIVVPHARTWRSIRAIFQEEINYISGLMDISLGGKILQYGLETPMHFTGASTAQLKGPHARRMAKLGLMMVLIFALGLAYGLTMIR